MTSVRQDIHNSDVPILCRSCEARHRGICGALEPDQLKELARATHKARHEAGSELIGESTPTTSYANVMRGVVKLSKVLEDGRQQLVGLQFAPDFLGRLFAEESDVTAEAAGSVELCVVPKGALERLIDANPMLERRLMKQALRELDEARNWMMTLGRKTAQERIASFLMLIATHSDPNSSSRQQVQFELPLARQDIADFMGLTIETVSRQLTKLRQMGIIDFIDRRHVVVPDIARLEQLCG